MLRIVDHVDKRVVPLCFTRNRVVHRLVVSRGDDEKAAGDVTLAKLPSDDVDRSPQSEFLQVGARLWADDRYPRATF